MNQLWSYQGFPDSSVGKESACNAGDPCSFPGLGRSPGEGKGYPLQYSGLENSMECIVHGVAKSWTGRSDFHFHLWINSHDNRGDGKGSPHPKIQVLDLRMMWHPCKWKRIECNAWCKHRQVYRLRQKDSGAKTFLLINHFHHRHHHRDHHSDCYHQYH